MKVALYARVSTQGQEKRGTIASQIEALRTYAKENHYEVDEDYVYCDNGYSGSLLARPALDRLRDAAQAGVVDAVLVHSPDRLARKYAYLVLILEEFEHFGTPIDCKIPMSCILLVTVTIKVLIILKEATITISVRIINNPHFSRNKASKRLRLISIHVFTKNSWPIIP